MKVTHIYHSGFLIELESASLIFDWYTGTLPELPKEKPVFVFVSHSHGDHYGPCIWDLQNRFDNVYYILDEGISDVPKTVESVSVKPRIRYDLPNDITVHTFESNDMGVAFLVEVEGQRIFHSGDLNVWFWQEVGDRTHEDNLASEAFCKARFEEVQSVLQGEAVDLAMLLLDSRLEDEAPRQVELFMQCVGATHIFPMHYWDDKEIAQSYLKDSRIRDYASQIHFDDFLEI